MPDYNPPHHLPPPPLRPVAPHRSRDARGVSSLEHESVYKFMIMTIFLHTYITIRTLLPACPAATAAATVVAGSGLCARARVHRFMLSAFSPSPHCVRRDDDPILHLYSTVRGSSQSRVACACACRARFCQTGKIGATRTGCNADAKTHEGSARSVLQRSYACYFFLFFLFFV